MKTVSALLAGCALALGLPAVSFAQAAPSATATTTIPTLNTAPAVDQLNYSLTASEAILIGYYGNNGVTSSTNISGTAAYVSGSQAHPTSFLYSGGYLFGDYGGQPSSTYQDFGVSQEFNTKHMTYVLSDQVSYLPNAPVFGLSGVVGVGDIGTEPIGTGSTAFNSILTNYGKQVTNIAAASATARFTGSTSLEGFGNYTVQRFPDDTGIDNDDVEGGALLDHRISGRNTVGAGYVYYNFQYESGYNLSITTQEAILQYQHTFSPRLLLSASAGPEFTSSTDATLFPSGTNVAADVSLFYTAQRTRYLLSYSRGTTAGSGVLLGTLSNNVNFTAQHDFDRNWSGGFSANYGYASSLESLDGSNSTASSFYTGIQANRRLGRDFSAYASYGLEVQSISGPLLVNAFNGVANVIGVGITYAPRPIKMGHH